MPKLYECNVLRADGSCMDTFHFEKDDLSPARAKQLTEETLAAEYDPEDVALVADVHVIDLDTGARVA